MTILFLDDYRVPADCYSYIPQISLYLHGDWDTVVDFNSFTEYFADVKDGKIEMPTLISFDHDLAKEHYNHLLNPIPYEKFDVQTGFHCALWLKDFCEENEFVIPEILCHSMNPAGKKNILEIFR